MTQSEYETIKNYEDTINEEVFKNSVEMLLEWIGEKVNLPFDKKSVVDDALKGFKMTKQDIRKIFNLDLTKI